MNKAQPKLTVLGAGVVGLSTALCLQDNFPRYEIEIIAEKFNEDTLSTGAGGLFRPELSIVPSPEIGWRWYKDSYDRYIEMINSIESCDSGFQRITGYHISSINKECVQNSVLKSFTPDYRDLTKAELELFPPEFKFGISYTTIITDCKRYLPWMKKQFEQRGGKCYARRLESLKEIRDRCDILINCTGLDAKKLVKDDRLIPIRGQTIKVHAPWIKHFYFGNENYIIPGIDLVTLGGIKQFGNSNPDIDPHDRAFIWNNCTKLVPSLQKSKIDHEWVGLRPFRQPVRVESELMLVENKTLKVVHNYGHGGHGVTLSWGTAKYATALVEELHKGFTTSKL